MQALGEAVWLTQCLCHTDCRANTREYSREGLSVSHAVSEALEALPELFGQNHRTWQFQVQHSNFNI